MESAKHHMTPLKSARIVVEDYTGAVKKIITKQDSRKFKVLAMPSLENIEQMTEYEVYFCLSLIPNSQFHGINLESMRKNICIEDATRYLTRLV